MKGTYKKIVTDINRGKDLETNIGLYAGMLGGQYNYYATVRLSMNYYTMKEVCAEQEDKNTDVCKYFGLVTDLLTRHILSGEAVDDRAITAIRQLRSNVEYKMKNLTAFTDGYELYEYILNRVEAGIKGTVEQVDADELSAKMFQYVFSENDTVVVNSKLKLLMAQLPVRMTKNKFYDVVSNTLSIYKGGETSSVDEFADMLRTSVLLKKPKGFETEYPYLYRVYRELSETDYKALDEQRFDVLCDSLSKAADIINNEVSAYLLLQEVINDVYTLLLTVGQAFEENKKQSGYNAALAILHACVDCDDMEALPEQLMAYFMKIEGVQEDVYENVMILEAAFDDIRQGNAGQIEKLSLDKAFERLSTVSKLLSTSLFIDLDREGAGDSQAIADNDYINRLKNTLTAELAELFSGMEKSVMRSMMCKLLSDMPIFLNSRQEIKDYFDYVLNNCKDDSELTACNKLICELIMEDA